MDPTDTLSRNQVWQVRAWHHWHRPWSVMHASWAELGHDRLVASGATEAWLRQKYPAWCNLYGLERTPADLSPTVAWRLSSLSIADFERALRLVGWTLRFAQMPTSRLMRGGPGLPAQDLRWALSRSHFLPRSVPDRLDSAAGLTGAPAATEERVRRLAAAALRLFVQDDLPPVWPRLRLRCDRAVIEAQPLHDGRSSDQALLDSAMLGQLSRLWSAAVKEILPMPSASAATGGDEPVSSRTAPLTVERSLTETPTVMAATGRPAAMPVPGQGRRHMPAGQELPLSVILPEEVRA
ncbi:hypothetical protein OU995_07760 [Roseateles sp. SL47]|uniref:hypothetical protein n=1 Tax=Roseateles sp. SL47 TaxID=2995138 RepID=UPI0022722070|nr:hypothetical protein [Roseateles sp. SL47]WAC74591.1 hypothetical protein OU995_07760 [Roseateles sp. SL47]